MSDIIKPLADYPDIDFIGGYTLEKLEAKMVAWYKEKYKEITKREPVMGRANEQRILLQTCAYYIFQGMKIAETNARMNTLKYAENGYLDNLGALKRVSRGEATAATVTLRFSLAAARTNATGIPAGTRVTAGDGVHFATQGYAEIPIGSTYIDVRAACLKAGTDGNLYGIGELNRMVDPIPFIDSVENVTAPEGGTDDESEEDYRESIYLAPESYSAAGSEGAYEYWVRKYSNSIIDVKVSSPEPRIVQVRCLLTGGTLPGEEFRSALQEYLSQDNIKMLTDVLEVTNPTEKEYNITVTYYINRSDSSRAETIQTEVAAAVDDYILWQKSKIGRDINPSELTRRMVNAGAKRVAITHPAFAAAGQYEVAVCGTRSVTYGGLEDD